MRRAVKCRESGVASAPRWCLSPDFSVRPRISIASQSRSSPTIALIASPEATFAEDPFQESSATVFLIFSSAGCSSVGNDEETLLLYAVESGSPPVLVKTPSCCFSVIGAKVQPVSPQCHNPAVCLIASQRTAGEQSQILFFFR